MYKVKFKKPRANLREITRSKLSEGFLAFKFFVYTFTYSLYSTSRTERSIPYVWDLKYMLISSAKFTGIAILSSHVEDPLIHLFVLCDKFILSFSSIGLDNSSLRERLWQIHFQCKSSSFLWCISQSLPQVELLYSFLIVFAWSVPGNVSEPNNFSF